MARSRARHTSPSDTRRLAVIGVVGAVAILGLLAFALTSGSDSPSSSSSSSTTTAPSSRSVSERALATGRRTQTAPTTTTTTTPVASMPDSFETFTERNPFQPAVGVSTGVTTPSNGATGTTPTSPTTSPSGTDNGPVTGGTATTETTTPPSQNPSSGTVVQLLEVVPVNGQPSARVQVASTVYTVTTGQTFATSYKLVSLSGSCGQFLFGDSPFQLCTGQQVLK